MSILSTVVIVIGCIILYIYTQLKQIPVFDRYLNSITVVILIQVLHISFVHSFFSCCLYYVALMPYALLYPPLLYFLALSVYKQKLKISYHYHLIPFFLFFLVYTILLFSDYLLDTYGVFDLEYCYYQSLFLL